MKTKLEIGYEVFEILNQHGFEVWWYVGHHYNIRRGQQWWLRPHETCNRIFK